MQKVFNKQRGATGEYAAANYLMSNGYKLLEQNYTTPLGEIDIIVTDGNTVVFVEVKTRANDKYGVPLEAVTLSKQRKISQVAISYIKINGLFENPIRFDVIELDLSTGQINHVENAFETKKRYY